MQGRNVTEVLVQRGHNCLAQCSGFDEQWNGQELCRIKRHNPLFHQRMLFPQRVTCVRVCRNPMRQKHPKRRFAGAIGTNNRESPPLAGIVAAPHNPGYGLEHQWRRHVAV